MLLVQFYRTGGRAHWGRDGNDLPPLVVDQSTADALAEHRAPGYQAEEGTVDLFPLGAERKVTQDGEIEVVFRDLIQRPPLQKMAGTGVLGRVTGADVEQGPRPQKTGNEQGENQRQPHHPAPGTFRKCHAER